MKTDDPADAAETIRNWMKEVMIATGMTAATWAKRAQLAPSTIQRAVKPDYKFVTSSRTLAKLAAVANRAPPEIRVARVDRFVPRYLSVRHKVQAGHWIEVDGDVQAPPDGMFPVAPDYRYSEWAQWLEEVVGDSVNLKIAPGSFAHVVDAIEMGYEAREGDFVVVERRRGGGLLRERTIKQIAIKDGAIEFWPRSTNPKWQTPLRLTDGRRGNEDIEVEIVGLVIGSYSPM